MNTYRYVVTVEAETFEQADQVMAERCHYDEDYGFDYSIDFLNSDVSVETSRAVQSILAVVNGDVFYSEDKREAVIIGDGWIIAVDDNGNTTEASVGPFKTGWEA